MSGPLLYQSTDKQRRVYVLVTDERFTVIMFSEFFQISQIGATLQCIFYDVIHARRFLVMSGRDRGGGGERNAEVAKG